MMEGIHIKLPDGSLPLPRLPKPVAAFFVAVLGFLSFIVSLDGEFVFDDMEAIQNNQDLLPETPVQELFSHDFWGSSIRSPRSHKSYRPLTVLSFRLNYALAGDLKPWGFHLVNLFLHSSNCVLVLLTFSRILQNKLHDITETATANTSKAAFLGSIIFAIHPIHTESVAGIVGRADLLSCFFFLLAFLGFSHSITVGQENGFQIKELFLLICTVTLTAMAMFSKEQGATVLGICIVYDVLNTFDFVRSDAGTFQLSYISLPTNSKRKVLKTFTRIAILTLAGAALIGLRFLIMDLSAPTFQPSDNPAAFASTWLSRFLSHNYNYSINIWLLLNPWWLCFDWSMGCIPVITGITDWRVIFPLCAWMSLLLLVWKGLFFFASGDSISRNVLVALAFLVIPFIPASNLLFTVGFVIAERVLYIPSIGFAFLVVTGFICLLSCEKLEAVTKFMCIFVLAVFMARSIQRSFDWLSEEALFTKGENVCPLNAKVHYNIGKKLADKGNRDGALQYYHSAVRLNPAYDQPLNNLGNLLKEIGKIHEAEMYLEKAVNISPSFAAGWMNLGIVKADLKKYKEAEVCYQNALKYRTSYPDAHFNLGNLYLSNGLQKAALVQFDAAVHLRPTHSSAWINKILLLNNMGRADDAVKTGKDALQYLPNEAPLYYHIGNTLGQQEKFKESENYFLKAVELNPLESSYHGNLGVLYHRWKKYKNAERHYQRSLELNAQNDFSIENYRKLKRAMNKG